MLLNKGARSDSTDMSLQTPLHKAAAIGSTSVCRTLALALADTNAVCNGGVTPLMLAAKAADLDCVQVPAFSRMAVVWWWWFSVECLGWCGVKSERKLCDVFAPAALVHAHARVSSIMSLFFSLCSARYSRVPHCERLSFSPCVCLSLCPSLSVPPF